MYSRENLILTTVRDMLFFVCMIALCGLVVAIVYLHTDLINHVPLTRSVGRLVRNISGPIVLITALMVWQTR